MHLYIDWSSVEVFIDDGSAMMTNLVLPNEPYNQVLLYARGGDVLVQSCDIWQLADIWDKQNKNQSDF
jgi:sucrose-6-phosphate hydrolase SacC (GH32 family)